IICGPAALAKIRRIGLTTSPTAEVRSPPFLALWLRTMRIPFLQATFVPVVLGSVIAFQVAHIFNFLTFFLTLLVASLIHIAPNMFNDYFDFKSGNDLQVKHQNPFAGGGRILT